MLVGLQDQSTDKAENYVLASQARGSRKTWVGRSARDFFPLLCGEARPRRSFHAFFKCFLKASQTFGFGAYGYSQASARIGHTLPM